MALYAMADNNVAITTNRDAAMYNAFANGTDFVIGGAGSEFVCSASSLLVTMQSGEGIIQGRHVTCEGTATVQVSASGSGYIVLRYDLTQSIGNELSLKAVPSLVQNDLINDGTVRDLALYSYTSTTSSVTLTDVRNVMNSPLDVLGDQIRLTYSNNELYIEVLDY